MAPKLLNLRIGWQYLVLCLCGWMGSGGGASGQSLSLSAPMALETAAPQRSLSHWLTRLHEASQRRTYIGTLVVTSGAAMSSSRIWHACDGEKQIERVESLTGMPRSTFRHNDEVITFSPDTRVAWVERREALGVFPGLLRSSEPAVAQYYNVKELGTQRIAGLDADVVQLQSRDAWRYSYQIWSEKQTGLMLKLQTLDKQGRVLEQQAFSELQLNAPVSMDKLTQMMRNTDGYRVERAQAHKTTAAAEGWVLKRGVPGYKALNCYRHGPPAPGAGSTAVDARLLQCVYSDGLASVSVFLVPHDASQSDLQEGVSAMGATQALIRRVPGRGEDPVSGWWLTVVGEVPTLTLQAFAEGLERRK